MRAKAALLFTALVALSGCKGCKNNPQPAQQKGTLAPLTTATPTMTLPVASFGDAVVSVPTGATVAMPVVVAVLGIGDTPEEQCEAWRDVVGVRAFVLCVRGAKHYILDGDDGGSVDVPVVAAKRALPLPTAAPVTTLGEGDDPPEPPPDIDPPPGPAPTRPAPPKAKAEPRQVGFYPVDVPTLDRELTAGLAALKQRFTIYVAEKSLVYAGFSRGAFLGASIVARHPDKFARAILIEGGQSAWTTESAASFAKGGGKRVLFACGQPSCLEEVAAPAALLKNQRIETQTVNGAGEGHGYKKQVKDELKKSLAWVTEGDPAWQ